MIDTTISQTDEQKVSRRLDINAIRTKVMYNHLEAGHFRFFNPLGQIKSKYMFLIDKLTENQIKSFDFTKVAEVKRKIQTFKRKNPENRILHLFQFKKGVAKTEEQIRITKRCENIPQVEGICFYEQNPTQLIKPFNKQIDDFVDFKTEKEKFIVLEIESESIREKVAYALSKDFKQFIFTSGEYKNMDLWKDLTSRIHKIAGEVIMVLLTRMNTKTRESYISKAIEFGVDYVIHGLPSSREDKEKVREILFLDVADWKYKEEKDFKDSGKEIDKQGFTLENDLYRLSRVYAIDDANRAIESRAVEIVV